jgi:hypothetical protein
MAKSEQVSAHNIANADWDSAIKYVPPSSVGEFSSVGCDPVVADLNAISFTETSRTPYDGDNSRSQGKFPTKNSGKQS